MGTSAFLGTEPACRRLPAALGLSPPGGFTLLPAAGLCRQQPDAGRVDSGKGLQASRAQGPPRKAHRATHAAESEWDPLPAAPSFGSAAPRCFRGLLCVRDREEELASRLPLAEFPVLSVWVRGEPVSSGHVQPACSSCTGRRHGLSSRPAVQTPLASQGWRTSAASPSPGWSGPRYSLGITRCLMFERCNAN